MQQKKDWKPWGFAQGPASFLSRKLGKELYSQPHFMRPGNLKAGKISPQNIVLRQENRWVKLLAGV